MSSLIERMDKKAYESVAPVSKKKDPSFYFEMAKSFLQSAGKYKKKGDTKNCYFNLKKYIVLINERLPLHPKVGDSKFRKEYQWNCKKAKQMKGDLINMRNTILGKKNLPPPPKNLKKKLPPPPKGLKRKSKGNFGDDMVVGIANNEDVQDYVGKGVSKLASNTKVQEQVADGISNMANNEEYQEYVGNLISENSGDNKLIAQMAKNKKVQQAVAKSISKTVGNKEFQRKTGQAIAKAATNKEVQKKVAKGVVGVAKGGFNLGKWGAKIGWSAFKKSQEMNKETK